MIRGNTDWFTTEEIDTDTYVISEYKHWEETHCYLVIGSDRCLLIDTGLGVGNLYEQICMLTDKPVTAMATHIHWDHIGGHRYFTDFYAHGAEIDWLMGEFPLPTPAIRNMIADRCDLPGSFDIHSYEVFQGSPARVLKDGDIISLGDRQLQVLHTPGHSPGSMCLWEKKRGYLFTGDLIYKGTLMAQYPSTDPVAYLESLEKVAALPVVRVFPGHHSLEISPEILPRVRDAFREIRDAGKLCHGSGVIDYGDWSVWL